VSGKEQTDPMTIKEHARQQMTHSVLWRNTQWTMSARHITHMVEIGSGKVLCGLAKKTVPEIQTLALNSVEALNGWHVFYNSQSLNPQQNQPSVATER
jgi:[acyl-carrier-protein] S-malonyltransferase